MNSMIAGILDKASEMTLFLNPLENSYERFGQDKAPRYISWSSENRSQLVRVPAALGEYRRAELRSPDPAANSYLAFALLIYASMHLLKFLQISASFPEIFLLPARKQKTAVLSKNVFLKPLQNFTAAGKRKKNQKGGGTK